MAVVCNVRCLREHDSHVTLRCGEHCAWITENENVENTPKRFIHMYIVYKHNDGYCIMPRVVRHDPHNVNTRVTCPLILLYEIRYSFDTSAAVHCRTLVTQMILQSERIPSQCSPKVICSTISHTHSKDPLYPLVKVTTTTTDW